MPTFGAGFLLSLSFLYAVSYDELMREDAGKSLTKVDRGLLALFQEVGWGMWPTGR